MFDMKMTTNGSRPQIFEREVSQQPLVRSYPNWKLKLWQPNRTLQILEIKTTTNGRQPQIIESGIYQQPLVESNPNLKCNLRQPI
jgi:hypothetical protein